jgi:hypothetical protein
MSSMPVKRCLDSGEIALLNSHIDSVISNLRNAKEVSGPGIEEVRAIGDDSLIFELLIHEVVHQIKFDYGFDFFCRHNQRYHALVRNRTFDITSAIKSYA